MAGISAHRPILKSMIGEKWRRRTAVKRAKSLCIVRKRKMHGKGRFTGKVCKMHRIACAMQATVIKWLYIADSPLQ